MKKQQPLGMALPNRTLRDPTMTHSNLKMPKSLWLRLKAFALHRNEPMHAVVQRALTEFLDRLDAHDLGAEIYVPLEFEGRVTVGDFRVASSQALLDVLEEMREELNVDAEEDDEDEEDEEEDDEDEGTVIEAQLRHIWHLVADGATESIEKHLPLHLQL